MDRLILALTAMAAIAVTAHRVESAAPVLADTIYYSGEIVTVNDAQPTAEAFAVKEGKILPVGNKSDGLKLKGDMTKVVDLGDKALLPGFLDGHSHHINSLLVANQCKLYAPPSGPDKDVPSIIAELKKYVAKRMIPKGELIMGYGHDDTVMPNGRLLNRDDLNAAFPDNPVRVDHVSMHVVVLNSLALKNFGISAEAKTPPGWHHRPHHTDTSNLDNSRLSGALGN